MKAPTLVAIASVLFACAAGADDAKPTNDRDPWNGFGVGSWVILTESVTKGDKTESHREKHTHTESKPPGRIQLLVKQEGKKLGLFDSNESTQWHVPGYDPALDPKSKLSDTNKQHLMIQGEKYACEVKRYDLTRGEDQATVSVWCCKDVSVPYREFGGKPRTLAMRPDVVRLDLDYRSKDGSMKASIRVVNLREERQIGKQKIVCVREEGEIEMSEGDQKGKGTVTTFLSDAVPGRTVETIAEGELGGVKLKKQMQIECFEIVE
jgi:hypothetical protein